MRRPAHATRVLLLAALAALAATFAVLAPAASATSYSSSSYAARLLALVNGARAQHELAPLQSAAGTTTVAAGWTAHLAAAGALSHNPDLQHQIEGHGSPDWQTYGENVGQGAADDPDGLFRAYMRSPEHRDNILTRVYRYVGVAVVLNGQTSWNTFDFVDSYGTPAPAKQPTSQRTRHHHAHAAHPQTRPAPSPTSVAVPAAPAHVHHHVAAPRRPVAHRAAHRAAQGAARPQSARHRAHHPSATSHASRPQVQGLRFRLGRTQPIRGVVASAATPAAPMAFAVPAGRSSKTVAVAIAVLALAAAVRRWTLTVVPG